MKPETKDHETQRRMIIDLLDAHGLTARRDAIAALIRPAIGLRTRAPTGADLAVGATRVGGEPDLPLGVAWPEGDDGPLLFVLQVDLADVAALDLEGRLPEDGLLSVRDPSAPGLCRRRTTRGTSARRGGARRLRQRRSRGHGVGRRALRVGPDNARQACRARLRRGARRDVRSRRFDVWSSTLVAHLEHPRKLQSVASRSKTRRSGLGAR